MKRILTLLYGAICYLLFLGTFVYAIGFVSNLVVPKSIDSGMSGPLMPALLVNLGLLGLFGLQHSAMARPGFKKWWTKFVPVAIERSTYVLFSSLALILLFWQWRPMQEVVWYIEGGTVRALIWSVCAVGWGLVLVSTFMISHAHLFGVSQVNDYFHNRQPTDPGFQTPGLYRQVRHPIMTGFLIAFWATPEMSAGHLVFALVTTVYIVAALQLEERDLINFFGDRYRAYRENVPMFFPRIVKRNAARPRKPANS